jgi:hypothetical protein
MRSSPWDRVRQLCLELLQGFQTRAQRRDAAPGHLCVVEESRQAVLFLPDQRFQALQQVAPGRQDG